MSLTRTADPKQKHVLAFCRRIASRAPVLLPITPAENAKELDCFNNARNMMAAHGGRVILGWAIWEWPGVYIEAEHHAVYDPGDGKQWIDPTPSETPGIETRLFLPDPAATYDFDNEGHQRDNHRQALRNDPLIDQFFFAARQNAALLNSLPGVGMIEVSGRVAQRFEAIQRERVRLKVALGMKYSKPNDACFCGSGSKFKKCHGRH